MSKCSNCKYDLGKTSFAFCTQCGTPLLPLGDLPTLPNVSPPPKKKKATTQVEDENKRLKNEIEKLKTTSAVLFGTTEEEADKRVQRILTISSYKFDILGRVERPFLNRDGEISYNRTELPDHVNKFKFYKKLPQYDLESDEIMYVATYHTSVDLQKELADIRLLLFSCAEQNIGCKFVMATNEDLTEHRSLVMNHFKEIKTALPTKKRPLYRLELWDQKRLLKLEHDLKIKVSPKAKTKRTVARDSAI